MFDINDIDSVKRAIRVDHDFDDELIMNVYVPSAIQQVKTAVSLNTKDEPFYKDNPIFNLAVLNIVAHHNDNRSTTSNEQSFYIPQSSLTLIQALRGNLVNWRKKNGIEGDSIEFEQS